MPVTVSKYGDTVFQGKHAVDTYRLLALKAALKLEIHGMKRRGPSVYSIVQKELGFKGTRTQVLAQLTDYCAVQLKSLAIKAEDPA